jgi:hypothetical protein
MIRMKLIAKYYAGYIFKVRVWAKVVTWRPFDRVRINIAMYLSFDFILSSFCTSSLFRYQNEIHSFDQLGDIDNCS